MYQKPSVVALPSPNFGYPAGVRGRGLESVEAIVDHIMGGSLSACDNWFRSTNSQVSAHYGIGKDGTIHQYVREEDAAWGAGILEAPDTTLPWYDPRGRVINQRVISIEHEGQPGDVFPPEQLVATIALHRYLVQQYSIPVDADHIVGHYRLDSVNRAQCPGPAFPWEALFAALGEEDQMDIEKLDKALDKAWEVKTALESAGNTADATKLFRAIVDIKIATGRQAAT